MSFSNPSWRGRCLRVASLVLAMTISRATFSGAAEPAASALDLARASLPFANTAAAPGADVFTADDHAFLDDLQKRGIDFFIDEADSVTGLMPDRAHAIGGKENDISSVASVGFGITALVVGEQRGWISRDMAYRRIERVLRFLRDHGAQERGHFYHFLNMRTGKREWNCEVSNIDTALLMAGVLTVRQHFPNTELAALCTELFNRVEWGWMRTDDGTLSMGWTPENGFIKAKWDHYSEGAPLILLLAMGSKTHPLPPAAWHAWKRDAVLTYDGLTIVQCPPLFTHQFPQCWYDLRGVRDDYANYYRNSQLATIIQRQWMKNELSKQFPTYGPNMWGLTASDFADGYTAWGGPPASGPIDGSVVPCAPAGSLAFEPRLCIDALKEMKAKGGDRAYVKYGFVDAFNPAKKWYNRDVIGIDVGATVLMAENARTGFVWKTFMSSPEVQAGMKAAGFRPLSADDQQRNLTNALFESKPGQ